MDDGRLAAQWISEEPNCLHHCAMLLADQSGAAPLPDFIEILEAKERAYEKTGSNQMASDMGIAAEDFAMLGRVRELVRA